MNMFSWKFARFMTFFKKYSPGKEVFWQCFSSHCKLGEYMHMQRVWRDVKQIKCIAAEMTDHNNNINWPNVLEPADDNTTTTTTNGR